jgi:hypothetical protein
LQQVQQLQQQHPAPQLSTEQTVDAADGRHRCCPAAAAAATASTSTSTSTSSSCSSRCCSGCSGCCRLPSPPIQRSINIGSTPHCICADAPAVCCCIAAGHCHIQVCSHSSGTRTAAPEHPSPTAAAGLAAPSRELQRAQRRHPRCLHAAAYTLRTHRRRCGGISTTCPAECLTQRAPAAAAATTQAAVQTVCLQELSLLVSSCRCGVLWCAVRMAVQEAVYPAAQRALLAGDSCCIVFALYVTRPQLG